MDYIEMTKIPKTPKWEPQTKTLIVLNIWNITSPLKQVYFEHVTHFLMTLVEIFSMPKKSLDLEVI
jgi:hypothetical protein